MILYVVCDLTNETYGVVEWFPTHERALREIDVMLGNEPSWASTLAVLRVDFARCEQQLLKQTRYGRARPSYVQLDQVGSGKKSAFGDISRDTSSRLICQHVCRSRGASTTEPPV